MATAAILERMEEGASDEELMRRYAAGEAAAFDELYGRHERRIWRYLSRNLRDEAVAEELMQDVWFRVARHAPDYRPTAKFTTWLFTLAHHRLVDAIRARRPATHRELWGDGGLDVESVAAEAEGQPDAVVAAAESTDRLLRGLATLPLVQRTVLLLHADGGLTVEEIATATGASFETTKSRLRYARSRLRDWLVESER